MVKIYVHAMTSIPSSHVYVDWIRWPILALCSAVSGPMMVYRTFVTDIANDHELAFYAS